MVNPYQVLGVNRTDDDRTVKKAYRTLSKQYHPDNNLNNPNKAQAEERFKAIQAAYEQIMRERSGDYTATDYDYESAGFGNSSQGSYGSGSTGNSGQGSYSRNTGNGSNGGYGNNSYSNNNYSNNNYSNNNYSNNNYGNNNYSNNNYGNSGYNNNYGNGNGGNYSQNRNGYGTNGYGSSNYGQNNSYSYGNTNYNSRSYDESNSYSNTAYDRSYYTRNGGNGGGQNGYYNNGQGYGFRGDSQNAYYNRNYNYDKVKQEQNDHLLREVANKLNSNSYFEARAILDAMEKKNDLWYYYSAITHIGLGNNLNALSDAKTAQAMNPNVGAYRDLVNSMDQGTQQYNVKKQGFYTDGKYKKAEIPCVIGSVACMRLCIFRGFWCL